MATEHLRLADAIGFKYSVETRRGGVEAWEVKEMLLGGFKSTH
jgi:hypothetical protein